MKWCVGLLIASSVLFSPVAHAQSVEDQLKARFNGRQGAHSEDRRRNLFDLRTPIGPGPKTGCEGDTLAAGVTINNVSISINGDTATVKATYSGKYSRQGWIRPCVHSPPPNGREDRNVYGTLTLIIKQQPFKNPEISWGSIEGIGEVSAQTHDSNKFALEAARNALLSGI